MKPYLFAILPAVLLLGSTPAHALSEPARANLSEYCSSIKQVLRSVQREDSRSRINIGSVYESISTNYITPLNLRLVANNLGSPELITAQSDFVAARARFSSKFIEYSRAFEQVLASDCMSNPGIFYERLETARSLRAELHDLTVELNATTKSIVPLVQTIAEGEKQ